MIIGGSTLFLHFIETALKDVHIRLYFMDKTSSLKIYPNEKNKAGVPWMFQFIVITNTYIGTKSRYQDHNIPKGIL